MAAEYKEYDYVEAGTIDVRDLEPLDLETSEIMKSEFRTGFKLTVFYYVFILTIPILNWFASDFMFSDMWGGMTYTWFFTSIIAMAMSFVIAFIHTSLYEKRLQKYQSETKLSSPPQERSVN
ncbi:hypothetical protein [Metabacillus iocasae]|uniref:Uncharacterized membrane protein (DUF485 family) n=1 Tax=Priestia iocasae TaxID=2291674 RepID=A0ABS2QXQ6_9BACI|nr:hypothetical protein [Metabacillus iocasae]MBM7704264.1 uncharacterized membrane protein (DUF485 family) [Metabacillus iocasae]